MDAHCRRETGRSVQTAVVAPSRFGPRESGPVKAAGCYWSNPWVKGRKGESG